MEQNHLAQFVCAANGHTQGSSSAHMHDPMLRGDSIEAHVEGVGGLDFLAAVLASEKLCQELGVAQRNVDRTMLGCEGLAIHFVYEHGRSSNMVYLQLLLPERHSNFLTEKFCTAHQLTFLP